MELWVIFAGLEESRDLCLREQNIYFAGFIDKVNCDNVKIIYFYHPDYLGSTEFITDMRGEPYQPVRRSLGEGGFFLNTPWGDQALRKSLVGFFSAGASLPRWQENQYAKSYTSFSSRFRFNGKEWDEETGNYYYGARYYNPKVSVWLSVDPMSDQRPSLTPYNFMSNNPVMRIEPTGMLDGWVEGEDGNIAWDADVSSQQDLVDQGKSGTYKGESGVGYNPETGNNVHYFEDGNSFEAPQMLADVEIDGGKMSDHARTMQNPYVQAVHRGQRDFLIGSSQVLQDVGDGVSLIGYGLTATGVGAPIGVPLAAIGGGASFIGGTMEAGFQAADGQYQDAALTMGFTAAGRFAPSLVRTKGVGGQILKQNVSIKIMGANRLRNSQK